MAMIFATFLSVAMRGIQIGTYDLNIKNAVELFNGYIQIQNSEYQENPSLIKNFKFSEDIIDGIKSIDEIEGFAPRIYADGLISYKDNSFGTALIGIDPDSERKTTKILSKIESGRFFEHDSANEIVIGYKLLKNLNAEIGDELVVLTQGRDGSLGNLKFRVAGTTKFGVQELDLLTSFIGLKKADELLSMYGRIHVVALNVATIHSVNDVTTRLNNLLPSDEIRARGWEEVMSDFKQSIELDNISGIFMLLILIIIVAFGILNTVLMSVTERFNEFGVSLSIGMPQLKLVLLVFLETILLTLIGLFLGNIIGWLINYYFVLNPIELGGDLTSLYEEYGFLPIIKSSLHFTIFISISLTILAVSLLSCLYPAYRVYKLEPLKGIRYT
jgi:ABC-type lipoprotein release transport system permease subunit